MILRSIKRFFGKFKPSRIRKLFFVTKKINPYISEVEPILSRHGFKKIKPCNKMTWKFYGVNNVRFTLFAIKDSKKVIIKIAKGFDEKMRNSISFQTRFNDVFDFIPKGKEFVIDGYKCYFTEYINSIDFSSALKGADKKGIDSYLSQANIILDELNKYKIVHCDLEEVNILVDRKSHKLYLIDWDTVCSDLLGFYCDAFPAYTIKKHTDNQMLFDDAYSFSVLFRRYVMGGALDNNALYKNIEEKIGRNTHITNNDN